MLGAGSVTVKFAAVSVKMIKSLKIKRVEDLPEHLGQQRTMGGTGSSGLQRGTGGHGRFMQEVVPSCG